MFDSGILFVLVIVLSMIFAFPVALIALILAATSKRDIRRLKQETHALKKALTGNRAVPNQISAKAQPAQTVQPVQTARPAQTAQPTQTVQPAATAQQPKPTPTPTQGVRSSIPMTGPSPIKTAAVPTAGQPPIRTAPTTPTPVQRVPSAATGTAPERPQPSPSVPVTGQTAPKPSSAVSAPPVGTPQKNNLEGVLGKNILGIAATALIFIGLIAFGVLIFTKITDAIKVLGMFLISFSVTGIGTFLSKKNRNTFTECLTGCGVGSVYISILITHLYFELIGDLVAFGLILLWAIGVFLLSKWISSKALVYIAYFGCILSTLLSIGYGQVVGKYIEITLYQIATFLLLLIANKKNILLYRFSCFASILLNTILSLLIQQAFSGTVYGDATISVLGLLCLALTVFSTATYLLFFRKDPSRGTAKNILMNLCYFISLTFGGFGAFYRFAFQWTGGGTFGSATFAFREQFSYGFGLLFTLGFLLIAGALFFVTVPEKKERLCSLFSAEIFLSTLLFWISVQLSAYQKTLPLTVLFALLNGGLALAAKKRKEKKTFRLFWNFSFAFFLADAVLSLIPLLEFEYFGILYSLLLIALSLGLFKIRFGTLWAFPFLQFLLINLHFVWSASSLSQRISHEIWLGLIVTTVLNIVLYLFTQTRNKPSSAALQTSHILTEIGSSLWVFVMSILIIVNQNPISAETPDPNAWYTLILSALILILGLIEAPRIIQKKNQGLCVWYAVKFTYLTLVPIGQFTTLFEEQFVLSLFFMILAALCILIGFIKDLKSVRIYGLVLVLTSVLKMVVLDVWNQESLIRVLSLIGGGIICFGISATYSYIEKIQARKKIAPQTAQNK